MAKEGNVIIKFPHLVLCEGADEKYFLVELLNSQEWSGNPYFSTEIQVESFGGVNDLGKYLMLLQMLPGYEKVRAITVVRDAETDFDAAAAKVKAAFEKAGYDAPDKPFLWKAGKIETSFVLFPSLNDEMKNGTLEDLCLTILREKQSEEVLEHINRFLTQSREQMHRELRHWHKSQIHTYFSITDKYVSLKIGEAAKAGCFDWNNPKIAGFMEWLAEAGK